MPTFDTPKPIKATLKLVVGDVRIVAGDRTETTVEVRPHNPGSNTDVKAAKETTVDFTGGTLLVKAPKAFGLFTRNGAIDVLVALPAGSAVSYESVTGDLHAEGVLGDCRMHTTQGDIRVERTGALEADTTSGEIIVEQIVGNAKIGGSGAVRITSIEGSAQLKNISGDTWVGACTGEANVSTANGDIVVEKAEQSVTARTANGDVRLRDVVRGTMVLETAAGELEIGVRAGTAAWLDANTITGSVRSSIAAGSPETTDNTVEVRARTFTGDILVHHS